MSKWHLYREGLIVECSNEGFDEYMVKVVPPGEYDLRFISDGKYPGTATHITKNDDLGLLIFAIEKGTVNYVGDFLFYPKVSKIEIMDNFEQAISFLQKKHPEIADKLTKNFAGHWVVTCVKKHLKKMGL